MRTFEHFPEESKCPLCNTNEDKECTLIPIAHTTQDGICEAQPTHVDCLHNILLPTLILDKEIGVIYGILK